MPANPIPWPKSVQPFSAQGVVWSLPLLGALPALAHPPLNAWPLAWVALAPAMVWLRHGRGGVALWCGAGWGYGLVHAALQWSWLPEALWNKGGLPFSVFLPFALALLATAALYPAVAFGIARWAWLRAGVSPYVTFPAVFAAQDLLLGVTPFGGVPWGSLAATQTATLAAAWFVPLFGGSGLVLVMGAAGAAWALAFGRFLAGRLAGAPLWTAAVPVLAVALLTGVCAWPNPPAADPAGQAPAIRLLLVPGDLPLRVLASPSEAPSVVREYAARTVAGVMEAAALAGPTPDERPALAVWPESAVPGNAGGGKTLAELFALATALEADLLFGSNGETLDRVHNSAYLVTGERFGTIRYDKRRLVPFGEYVPAGFGPLFGKKITAGVRDYSPGTAPPVLDWRGLKLGLAICFESIHPQHTRDAVLAGAVALVAISNDGWLTPGAARQHVQLSALRALEVGRDLAFVSNGGPSALVRRGTVVAELPRGAAPRLVTLHVREELTPWARWGLVMPLMLIAAWLILAGALGLWMCKMTGAAWRHEAP